jgi:magnesium-transporting ATPase (P-type)
MKKYLSWSIYIRFVYIVAIIFALLIAFVLFFTSAWSGVDGGLGLVAALFYLFCIILFIAFSHLLHLWLRRHPLAMRYYLTTFWVLVCIGTIMAVVTTTTALRQENNQKAIKDALQSCSIKQVSWNYTPASLIIKYTDKNDFELKEWSDPTYLAAEVRDNKARCGAGYNFTINSKLQTK